MIAISVQPRCPSLRRIAAVLLPVVLSACGGGGDDSRSENATASDETAAPVASPLPTQPAVVWTSIATENQAFTVSGPQTVRYGSGSTWIERSVSGDGRCSNGYFGIDPLPGIVKECQLATDTAAPPPPTGITWTRIAVEYQPFTVSGTQTVRYGSGSIWIERSVTGDGRCSNSYFGIDPLPGIVKECQLPTDTAVQPPPAGITWTRIAIEYQPFAVSGTQTVRYGSGSSWTQRSVTGAGQCTNTFFGNDPLFGVAKECQVASSTATPPPPGTSAARIVGIELAQSLLYPSADPELVLLPDKALLVKVNAITSNAQQASPAGMLQVETAAGQLVQVIPLAAPTAALPATEPLVPSFSNAYTAVVPAHRVTPGLRLTASLANGQPATTVNPRVGGGIAMNFVAVPIQIAGTVGEVVAGAESFVQARMPVVRVTLRVRTPYASWRVPHLPTTDAEWSNAYNNVLGELNDLHLLEQASAQSYYVGFMPKRSYGLAGLGYVPGNASLTFDMPSSPRVVLEILTHELGHNFSLPHAPCGDPSGPDPQYPYANALLGAPGRYIWGYNAATQAFTDPRRTDIHDIMSYCAGDTFSDYNYRKMQVFQTPSDRAVRQAAPASAAGPQELLLVSGQIGNGKAEMTPVKSLFGQARLPANGAYTLRITTAQGTVDYPFASKEIDHVSTVQHFAFTIPHPGAVVSMAIVKDGTVLMNNQAKPAGIERAKRLSTERPQVQATQQGGVLSLTWDNTLYPYLTVTHVAGTQRHAMAQDLQGGTAWLPAAGMPAGGSFEFSLSDGLNTARVMQAR